MCALTRRSCILLTVHAALRLAFVAAAMALIVLLFVTGKPVGALAVFVAGMVIRRLAEQNGFPRLSTYRRLP